MMLDNFRFFDIDDPKLETYKTNGSAGWCGSATKYIFYLGITILGREFPVYGLSLVRLLTLEHWLANKQITKL